MTTPISPDKNNYFMSSNLTMWSRTLMLQSIERQEHNAMQIEITYEVLASDWSNLFSTLIDGSTARYWCSFASVQTVSRYKVHPSGKPCAKIWRWDNYGDDVTYEKEWRAIVKVHKELRGSLCTDGKRWGYDGEGSKVRSQYTLLPKHIARAANLAPKLIAEWIESGERNISTSFDSVCAERLIQLACFGVEVFA